MRMAITVTDQMVDAAHRQLPGISNRVRVRVAVEAAMALVPDAIEVPELPVVVKFRCEVDREQLGEAATAALCDLLTPYGTTPDQARLIWAPIAADEPHVTEDGLEGPGVTDATGQTPITINEPRVLAGITEIAARLQVGRSTIAGWTKAAETNGMPAPIATLAAGPVYDLDAVAEWHAAWKAR